MPREVVEETFDVIVIGGGLAGVCAAVAAARHGAYTALIQDRPVLGGNSSNEVRVSVTGASAGGRNPFARETGIVDELLIEDRFRSSTPYPVNGEPRPNWDWLLAEWVTREPNLVLFLNTRAVEPVMDPDASTIRSVRCLQTSTEREYLLHAHTFVDASGDGSIAAQAGAEFRYGREGKMDQPRDRRESLAPLRSDEEVLGSSLMFSARDVGHPVKFTPPPWAHDYPKEEDIPYREHSHIAAGYWWIEWGGKQDTIGDNELIRDELLKMVYGIWDHIKNHGSHKADNLELDWVGSVVGKRESRRFLGDYVLSQMDIEERPQFPDAVAYGGWPMDTHPADGLKAREMACIQIYPPGPYAIPLRCLYSKDVPNLFLAGRNISATHLAFASARVMGTCAVEGQAVGTAAWLCAQYECFPRDIATTHIQELQQILLKDGCYIPGVRNRDEGDLLRGATVTETSHYGPLEMTHFDRMLTLDSDRAQMFTVSEPYLERVSVWLESDAKEDVEIRASLYRAEHLTDFSSTDPIAVAVATLPPKRRVWVTFPFEATVEPGGVYWIKLDESRRVTWGLADESIPGALRAERMEFRKLWLPRQGCHTFRLIPKSYPYRGSNVVSGGTRPERGPELWISDPSARLPQSVELELPGRLEVDTVYLTFDTDLDKLVSFGPVPECVRDYTISYLNDKGEWEVIVRETNNHHRLRRHEFPPVYASRLRLTVTATNGAPSARVYEIRAYRERPEEPIEAPEQEEAAETEEQSEPAAEAPGPAVGQAEASDEA
ncbi:MAG: FAD-dependent oxidoreductase [Anaerolineae bacterium]|nr:FAD-dependent oxidoreductase [Anaerolineae bacterium]